MRAASLSHAGPARLPQHHRGIIGYCREFGVPLEVMVNDNRSALFHDDHAFAGKPVVARQVINDGRGFIAELLAKAIDGNALDNVIAGEDKETAPRFRAQLRRAARRQPLSGLVAQRFRAAARRRRHAGQARGALAFAELLRADFCTTRCISPRASTSRRRCCSRSAA